MTTIKQATKIDSRKGKMKGILKTSRINIKFFQKKKLFIKLTKARILLNFNFSFGFTLFPMKKVSKFKVFFMI